jgi:Regulator of ribonuclease activity B
MGFFDRIRNMGAPTTVEQADDLLLRQLAGLGADLTRPRHVIHYLYFGDEANAMAASEVTRQAGYETTVTEPDETITQWSVRAESHRVCDRRTVEAFRTWFEELAREHQGEYDGWEAAAEP